jgi:hypothetical protein
MAGRDVVESILLRLPEQPSPLTTTIALGGQEDQQKVEERASEGEGTGREEKWKANEFTITIHREECSNPECWSCTLSFGAVSRGVG